MKYLHYILRNVRRNPVRTFLTVASLAITLFLTMILLSFFAINGEVSRSSRVYNRIVVLSSQGFAGRVPIARNKEISAMEGIVAASPFSWFGGKYKNQTMPFAQFGVDPDTFFAIYDELTVPADQLKALQADKTGCVVGKKLAEDWGLKLGDPLPLKGDIYPVDLNLTVRAIYDGPPNRDRRMCLFHWEFLDELLKTSPQKGQAGNAGCIVAKCKSASVMVPICHKIDAEYKSSDTPTLTQSEEAFGQMFGEMMKGLQWVISMIGLVVVVALVFVAGNAMAMALRERTTEIAVLKAIGFSNGLVLFLVLAEAMFVAGIGGALGSFGCKFLCDTVDVARYSAGFLPFFYVSAANATMGLVVALLIGFFSGLIPAVLAARSSVINGLRKVV
ncbi:MAG: ABC transporter permease [Isosphaeraceae bacterium]|nr:ABC transporter permease [Isosphaeraceae bacterium]